MTHAIPASTALPTDGDRPLSDHFAALLDRQRADDSRHEIDDAQHRAAVVFILLAVSAGECQRREGGSSTR